MAAALKSLHIQITIVLSLIHLALPQEQNHFIYNGFLGANLNLSGTAKIHSNGLLELTEFSKQKIGRAFFPFPLKFNTSLPNNSQSLSFSTNFVFAMVPEFPTLGGHGITFTISPSMELTGAVASQYFGLFNSTSNGLPSNHIVAVEIDTIRSPEFEDIDDNHVGIDVNNLKSIDSAPATYFSDKEQKNMSLKLIGGNPMQMWIEYDEVEKRLNVTLAPVESTKPSRPLLSTNIDLSLDLLDSMYVGFSASTGAMASNQYILGWSFNKSGQAQSLDSSKLPLLPPQRKSKKKPDPGVIVLSIVVTLLLITISGAIYIIRKKKYEEIREDWEQEFGPQRFSYKDLYRATKGFKDKELLGFGGFGRVYKGVLPSSNVEVAVKRISHDSKQGVKEFFAEIATMGRLRHRNLVQLLGYCRRKGELLLVYDYMPNGSLDKFLFSNRSPNLNWFQRYQILREVASGLLYLHEEWDQVVLHRDVKASNVLLDADLNGRLGDFGLAKFHDHGANPQTTILVGTVGYIAPELTRTGKATTSSDVFAFGIFMLEMACGRKTLESQRSPEEMILVEWVVESWKSGIILETSDPRLEGNYVVEEMELVLKLGMLCAHTTPAARPSMRKVVQYLDGNATCPEISLDGAGIGMELYNSETSTDVVLSLPTSYDYTSVDFQSSSEPILSSGH